MLLHHKPQAIRIVWINFSAPILIKFTYSFGRGATEAVIQPFNMPGQ